MAKQKIIKSRHYVESEEVFAMAEVPESGNRIAEEKTTDKQTASPSRVDGYVKVSGTAQYTFDIQLPGMLHTKILRSPHPHARITKLDVSEAESMPGVFKVISHLNTPRIEWYGDSFLFDPYLRYVGDEIACVAAETEWIANEALKRIRVEYEVLPFVLKAIEATKKSAVAFHEEGSIVFGQAEEFARGDVERGFNDADAVVEDTYTTEVLVHNPAEPHCSVARWDGTMLTIWDSTQGIYDCRDTIARSLGISENKVRVLARHIGGGFGSKLETSKHTVMAALLARESGRPVKIVLSREEQNLAVGNRPDSVQKLKVGAKSDGMLTAMSTLNHCSAGAYNQRVVCYWPFLTMYQCSNLKLTHYSCYTNLGRARPFRAPGHPEGTFALDSILDDLAEKIGMDPLEFRLKNYAEFDQMRSIPYTSKKLREAYRTGAERIGWDRRAKVAGSDEGPIKRGIGMASQIWWGGGGPPAAATLKMNSDGSLHISAGTQDLGTGTRTILTQIAADVLEIPLEEITVSIGDSATGPYCPLSGGSQTLASVTPAVQDAALQIKDVLMEGGAQLLEVETDQLVFGKDSITTKDQSKSVTIREIIGNLGDRTITRTGRRGANPEGYMIQSFGAQFAEVEVDTMTGRVRVIRIVAAHDIGRAVNPMLVENQFHGGIIQGMGMALFEERRVDKNTGKVLNTNLLEYRIPTINEIPEIEVHIIPHSDTLANSVGAKGCGEPPIIPTAGAIANAVYNATGIRFKNLPITPDKVLSAIAAQGRK